MKLLLWASCDILNLYELRGKGFKMNTVQYDHKHKVAAREAQAERTRKNFRTAGFITVTTCGLILSALPDSIKPEAQAATVAEAPTKHIVNTVNSNQQNLNHLVNKLTKQSLARDAAQDNGLTKEEQRNLDKMIKNYIEQNVPMAITARKFKSPQPTNG